MKYHILAVASLALLAGCTAGSTSEPLGSPPANAQAQAKAALRSSLKNPFDVRDVRISKLTTVKYDVGIAPQWTVCVSLYARNGFNAMNRGEYYVAFKNGAVSNVVSVSDYGYIKSQAGQCGSMTPTSL